MKNWPSASEDPSVAAAAAAAAGLPVDWSTMRLLIVGGRESAPTPEDFVYEVGDAGAGPGPSGSHVSALPSTGVSSRGKSWSAAPKALRPGLRLFSSPVTVRRP